MKVKKTSRRSKFGRKAGSRNRGYFFHKRRGYWVLSNSSKTPLLDPSGNKLRDVADTETVKEAFARWTLAKSQEASQAVNGDQTTVTTLAALYLDHQQRNKAAQTYQMSRKFIFDFCTGLPSGCADKFATMTPGEKKTKRLHDGFGERTVGSLIPLDVEQWIAKHPGWKSPRDPKKVVKAMTAWGVEQGMLSANPLSGVKSGRTGTLITDFSVDEQQAILKVARPAFGQLIDFCIRTGCRYFSEYCRLEARHISCPDHNRMVWTFDVSEHKTGKKTGRARRVLIVDPQIIAATKGAMAEHSTGPIFRGENGQPWTHASCNAAWQRVKAQLAKNGVALHRGARIYTVRHTYAKRMLWQHGVDLSHLSKLMGNTLEICIRHYAQWSENYDSQLWASLKKTIDGKK